MRRKTGSICMLFGLLFFLAAFVLLLYNRWDDRRAGQTVAEIQDALEKTEDEKDYRLPADEIPQDDEMDTVEIDGYEYIGTLSVPSFGLELPVMSEWSYPGLKIAPGRYSGSVWTNNLIICGHNYSRHFGNLKYLEAGDLLYFTDVNGSEFFYEVEESVILQPTDVEKMIDQESEDWDLTLFTCTLGGQARVTVRCNRIDE